MSDIEPFSESDRNGGGEDIQQHETDMQPQALEGIEAAYHTSSPEPQRSQRARKLTEKGQELHKKSKGLNTVSLRATISGRQSLRMLKEC